MTVQGRQEAVEAQEYSFDELQQYTEAALDRIRHQDGLEWPQEPYQDNEKEDGPGAFVVLVDGPAESMVDSIYMRDEANDDRIEDLYDQHRELQTEEAAMKEQLVEYAADNPEDEALVEAFYNTVDQIYDSREDDLEQLLEEEYGRMVERPVTDMAGTYWDSHDEELDLRDPESYKQIFETAESYDGAIVIGTDGPLPYTVRVPQLNGHEDIEDGTKHQSAKEIATIPVYADEDGRNRLDIASYVLSETDGGITGYGERSAHHPMEFGRLDYPAEWGVGEDAAL